MAALIIPLWALLATAPSTDGVTLTIAPTVSADDAARIEAVFAVHGIPLVRRSGPADACQRPEFHPQLCLMKQDGQLTAVCNRPSSAGGDGKPIQTTLTGDPEQAIWSLWLRSRFARRVAATGSGRVSVDGERFQQLPVHVPYADGPVRLVVELESCPVFSTYLSPETDRLDLTCPTTHASLRVQGPDVGVEAEVRWGETVERATIAPMKEWYIHLPVHIEEIEVSCHARGHLSWQRRYHLSRPREINIRCEPRPAWQFVALTTNVDGPVVHLDGKVQTHAIPVDDAEHRPTLPVDAQPMSAVAADQWVLLTIERLGHHELCVTSLAHERGCVTFIANDRLPSHLTVHPPLRPNPPHFASDRDHQNPIAHPDLWTLHLSSSIGVERLDDPLIVMLNEVMLARWFGAIGIGAALGLQGDTRTFGWNLAVRFLVEHVVLASAGLLFRQDGRPWATVGDIERQIYAIDLGLHTPELAGWRLFVAGELGAEEHRIRDYSRGRLMTAATFDRFVALRTGLAYSW